MTAPAATGLDVLPGMFTDGYTDDDIEHLSALIRDAGLEWTPACVWAYVDDDGFAGDSEIVAITPDGDVRCLPDTIADALYDSTPVNTDGAGTVGAPRPDINPAQLYRNGANHAMEDRRS